MSGSLQGKVAIITGASKGIGAGIAKAFAAQGASVVVNYSSSRAGADAVVSDIKSAGGKAVAVGGSVAKEAEVKRLFAEAYEAFGRLDILVNNAGVYQFGALEEVTEAEFHRQFDTNVLGPILATREAVKLFPAEGGSVINISSIASEKGLPGATIYGATKGALDQVTRTHAIEFAPKKMRVNTIAPGGAET
jgi:3-oxoacyl-[acyl-carrier protein] reductase